MSESNPEQTPLLRFGSKDMDNTPVFPIIRMIRSDIVYCIDTPLSYEALLAPDLTYSLIRPLFEKYTNIQREGNLSVVFCLLLNRVYFLRDDNMTTTNISKTRASLCEILATRVFRQLGADMYSLALALTTTWSVYSGTDPSLIAQAQEERDEELESRVGNAIEMAILGKSRKFIKSSACQKVIMAIWSGKCVYQAQSSHSILSDTYKRNPVHFYDPHKAPLLDHYRLKVPAIRSVLEYLNFLLLFILFVLAIEFNELDVLNYTEIFFMVYALGFTLEKIAAMQEHGIRVFFKGTWNGFDLAFVTFYCIYATLRLYGVYHHKYWAQTLGIDFLALIAASMFPRLAFVTLKDNLMVLSLRAMFMKFMILMFIAAFCFCGFLYALWTLSRNSAGYSVGTIAWWMLDLYFGLDASGFDRAWQFHPVFGPVLMVTYACLSNTLLLTVLVSILSNTFAKINEDAAAEAMFRKAVSTIEGVKADSLFSYQPPVNLLALCIMLPASYVLTPRWFHKVNVFMIRVTNFPVLLFIALYERQAKKVGTTGFYDTVSRVAEKVFDTLPRSLKRMTIFEGLAGSNADIDVIFEIDHAFDSALDTNEELHEETSGNSGPITMGIQFQQRRKSSSNKTPPHFSNRVIPPTSPTSPKQQVPRIRVDSLSVFSRPMNMASFASPLTQMYPPMVDNIPEETPTQNDNDFDGNGNSPRSTKSYKATGVSSVPFGVARKRIGSLQPLNARRHGAAMEVPLIPGQSSQRRKASGSTLGEKNKADQDPALLSQSPENITTASHVQDVEDQEVPLPIDVHIRLDAIEKRQERIETLLEQIAARL